MNSQNHDFTNNYTAENKLYGQGNPYQNSNDILTEVEKSILKFMWKHRRPQIAKPILNQKKITMLEVAQYLISNYAIEP
jgi:hypothetical protein